MRGATVVLQHLDAYPLTPEQIRSKPGLSATFYVDAGAVNEFMADPWVQAYYDNDVPIIVEFEDVADALELERRLAAARGSIQ
jgi:hypothetical protein